MHWIDVYVIKVEALGSLDVQYLPTVQGYCVISADAIDLQGYDCARLVTKYWGGSGTQSAQLWLNGVEVSLESTKWPINEALRRLGVVTEGDLDEFDTIGLRHFRGGDDFKKFFTYPELQQLFMTMMIDRSKDSMQTFHKTRNGIKPTSM